MRTPIVLGVLGQISGLIWMLCGTLLGSRAFSKGQRSKYRVVRWLDGRQVALVCGVIVFLPLSAGIGIFREFAPRGEAVTVTANLDYRQLADALLQQRPSESALAALIPRWSRS